MTHRVKTIWSKKMFDLWPLPNLFPFFTFGTKSERFFFVLRVAVKV